MADGIAPSKGFVPAPGEDWAQGTHIVRVSPQEMRRLLGPADAALRRQRSSVYFNDLPNSARARLPLGMHDRFEEYVFADGRLHPEDAAGHARHFPAHLKVVRLAEHVIEAGQTWDVSATHTLWDGVHFREELYLHVRIDRLIVAPGAALEVHGNIFVLECDEICFQDSGEAQDSSVEPRFEIRLGPTRHAAYSKHKTHPGASGADGADGEDAPQRLATRVIGTPFGPSLQVFSPDLAGGKGTAGASGKSGTAGQNGGMLMLADLRFGRLIGFQPASLRISAEAGAGLPGGAGGKGGKGGDGSHGADGVDGLEGLIRGGPGGCGGDGGDGGDGGRGGNGGLASNIFIQTRPADLASFDLRPRASRGGPGGHGGAGGKGGEGAAHGALAECAASGTAPSGANGHDGKDGNVGKSRPGPVVHVHTSPAP